MTELPMNTEEKQEAFWRIYPFYEGIYMTNPKILHEELHKNKRFNELALSEQEFDFCEHMIIWNVKRQKSFSQESKLYSKVWFNEYTTL